MGRTKISAHSILTPSNTERLKGGNVIKNILNVLTEISLLSTILLVVQCSAAVMLFATSSTGVGSNCLTFNSLTWVILSLLTHHFSLSHQHYYFKNYSLPKYTKFTKDTKYKSYPTMVQRGWDLIDSIGQ